MPGAEPDTKWVDSISRSNVIAAWLLCAYSRDGTNRRRVVWEGVKRHIAGTATASEGGLGRRAEGGSESGIPSE